MMLRAVLIGVFVWVAAFAVASAQDRRPQLMDKKSTLYQKVLTRPGAAPAEGVGGPGAEQLDPFTVLYVYDRYPVDGGGKTWLEVGTDAKGRVIGFLPEDQVVPLSRRRMLKSSAAAAASSTALSPWATTPR